MTSPFVDERLAGDDVIDLVVVRGTCRAIASPGALPVVVAWVGEESGTKGPAAADLVVADREVGSLVASVERTPLAARTLVVLLRTIAELDLTTAGGVELGLALESTAYSLLQAGPEFAAWRGAVVPTLDRSPDRTVRTERAGDRLTITLSRPERHNAITAQMRDELTEALVVAVADESVQVELLGDGPSFCSGGDLREFGARADPVAGHVTRLARSPARLIHRLRDRMTVRTHGATLGGGLEIAAFAGRVTAQSDTVVALPELGLGLIPGAGGTVSLTSRMGRQRTALLALTGRQIDARVALLWGLVDEIIPSRDTA